MRKMRQVICAESWPLFVIIGLTTLLLVAACDTADRGPTGPVVLGPAGSSEAARPSSAPSGSSQSDAKGFFPLEIGNRWAYEGELSFSIEYYGAGRPMPSDVIHIEEYHTLIGTEELFGREYIVEEVETHLDPGGPVGAHWVRYRQDRNGLYEADVVVTEPSNPSGDRVSYTGRGAGAPAGRWSAVWQQVSGKIRPEDRSAFVEAWGRLTRKLDAAQGHAVQQRLLTQAGPPGGVLPDEITRLLYPLHPRQEWTVREDPFFGSIVEGHDVLDLPPGRMNGFKIRMNNEFLGPEDMVLFWYGRDGFLGRYVYIESDALEPGGTPVGRIITEESLFLEELSLAGPGGRF